jgi:predicted small lipoprotein YifL
MRALAAILLASFVVASLGACGRRGDPEVPPGQVNTLKTTVYPAENACHGSDCDDLINPKPTKAGSPADNGSTSDNGGTSDNGFSGNAQ